MNCPCCSKELISVLVIEGTPFSGKIGETGIQRQGDRMFKICPHCQNEIELIGTGGIRVSPIQPCGKSKPQQ